MSAGMRSRADVAPEESEPAEPEAHFDPEGESRPLLRAVAAPEPEPEAEVAPAPQSAVTPDVLAAWRTAVAERDGVIAELSAAVSSRDADLAQLRAAAAAEAVPADDHTEELAQLRGRLQERDTELAAAGDRVSVLAGELESLQARLASAGASAQDRGRELAEAHLQTAAFNTELQALRPRLTAAETELVAVRARLAAAEAELALASQPAEPAAQPDRGPHVLFVPRNGGYELVERDGPAPARGTIVEADAASYVVAKVGAPRPGEPRTCVYLVCA